MSQVKCRYLTLKALMLTALFSVSAQAAADRDAWISASLLGTTEAYESFLENFPDSRYAEQALEALARRGSGTSGSSIAVPAGHKVTGKPRIIDGDTIEIAGER